MGKYNKLVLSAAVLLSLNLSQAQLIANRCLSGALDWDNQLQSPAFPLNIGRNHTIDIGVVDNNSALLPTYPINADNYSANLIESEYNIAVDIDTLDTVTVTIDITGDPSYAYFSLFDVDGFISADLNYQEVYTVTGYYQGNPVMPRVFSSGSSQIQVSGNIARGTEEVKDLDTDPTGLNPDKGILYVGFDNLVDSIQIVFSKDIINQNGPITRTEGFAIGDIYLYCRGAAPLNGTNSIPTSSWFALTALLTALIGAVAFYQRQKG